jgi:hypothetical protein
LPVAQVYVPQYIEEIKDRQTDVVLVICDIEVIFEAENLRVTDVGSVEKGAKKEQC